MEKYIQPTDEQIRVRAYNLWETEGRPQGRDWDYWMKAKQQLERELSGSNGSTKKSTPAPTSTETKKRQSSRSPVLA